MRTNNKIDILARTEELSNIRPKGSHIFASRIAMHSSRHFWAKKIEIGRVGEWFSVEESRHMFASCIVMHFLRHVWAGYKKRGMQKL